MGHVVQEAWLTACHRKMRPIGCPETSVSNYQSRLRNIPEEGRSRLHCGGSTKSASIWILWINGQLDAQLLYIIRLLLLLLLLLSSTCFEQLCAHYLEVELYYTASGIAFFVSDRPACRLRRNNLISWWWAQSCSKHVEDHNNKRII